MVVATANYKHIKEKNKELFDRETRLGRWVSERKDRKEKLKELNERIRSRHNSICSTNANNYELKEAGLEDPPAPPCQNPEQIEPKNIPDTEFMVEEDEDTHNLGRYPCGRCVIS